LSGGAALQLVVLGRVVRSGDSDTAVVIEKYEFRTRGKAIPNLPAGPLAQPGLAKQ
jgi:hypothetical protein